MSPKPMVVTLTAVAALLAVLVLPGATVPF